MAFFFYLICANAFNLPLAGPVMFYRYYVHWYGSALCFIGLLLAASAVITLGVNFRIGLDEETPVKLVTKGPFAINRNPLYTGMVFIFAGVYITYASWIFLVYALAGALLVHRQILREETSLYTLFNNEYAEYCKIVGRYF